MRGVGLKVRAFRLVGIAEQEAVDPGARRAVEHVRRADAERRHGDEGGGEGEPQAEAFEIGQNGTDHRPEGCRCRPDPR